MKRLAPRSLISFGRLLVLFVVLAASASRASAGEWKTLPSLPDREGFAGMFAGVSGDALVVAGGANFPDKKPWEGGSKVWHDSVFSLERGASEWKLAGRLPRPLGYGVSVAHRGSVVCVGGNDATSCRTECFRLVSKNGRLTTSPLPALPRPLANACGALVGDSLYVVGGQETPEAHTASNAALRIDLAADEPHWETIESLPGRGRVLAAAAALDGALYVIGGAALVERDGAVGREYLRDAYRFEPSRGWTRVADSPRAAVAAPSPCPTDVSGFYLLGGDDGSQVGVAPGEHRGFGATILRYNPRSNEWSDAGTIPAPRVTTPCVRWDDAWAIPSGEVRPGVRSPEVSAFSPVKRK